MSRIALVIAMAALPVLAQPAGADTVVKSQDGTVQITVPNGWRETNPFSPAIKVQAVSARGAVVLVRVVSKEDFKELKSFANVALDRLKKNMPDAEPKMEDIKINNKAAIRVSMEGTQANGQRRGYLLTFFENNGNYVDVIGFAPASIFQSEEQTLAALAGQVEILATSDAAGPVAVPPQTPPTTPTPGGRPPTTRPPH